MIYVCISRNGNFKNMKGKQKCVAKFYYENMFKDKLHNCERRCTYWPSPEKGSDQLIGIYALSIYICLKTADPISFKGTHCIC